ncbi:MAG: NAD(P)H-dependent oxidoreductase subunit E [Deltaproteobacteria bacterium]|nr:NAD(P)H-dependent oxidoreductase subunit E [Deltaproteobacteria bacterium]
MEAQIEDYCAELKNKPGSLIPVLQRAQEICGYLPAYVQQIIAKGLNLPLSDIYGVVSFYSFFTMIPKGRHTIRVCLGTACFVRGANETLNRFSHELKIGVNQTTEDRRFTLEAVRCLGACGLAPVTVIGSDTHRMLTADRVAEVIKHYE